MVRVNEDLRQEVGFAANEALQTYGGDPLMRRSGPSGMNQVELVAIIDREQRRLAALNSSIDKTQSTLVDVKLREGSEIIRLGKTKKMAQYVTMLENRLQRSLLKHNAMHAANSSLKQVQEQMRRDISFADTLQVGINQQLKTVQDQICKRAATFDEIVAHNERSRETLTVLHRSSEQWHSTFNSDWGALSQLINDQSDDFPTPIDPIQNQERLQMLLYDPELVSLRQQSGFALEEMAEKTAIVTKYNRLEQYKRTESVLRGATGIDNIDGLVNVFIDQENATFRWYSEINELAKEEEALRTAPIVATTAKDEEIGKLSWKDELVGKVEEMKGELVKVMEIDERTQTEMKEVTRKIQEMANHLVGNDKQFHLKDGLIVLEEYVHNLVQSLEQEGETGSATKQEQMATINEESFEYHNGVDITFPSIDDLADLDEHPLPNTKPRLKSILSGDAIMMFCQGISLGQFPHP